jgi:hypothetical protein
MTIPMNIPTPAQMEALTAGFQRIGRAIHELVDALGPAARRLILQPGDHFSFVAPSGPTIGRKRRARRARGRRIEANHA